MTVPKPFGRLGSRGSPRIAANVEVLFETLAQTFKVSLYDVSRHGARIEAAPLMKQGVEGVLHLGDLAFLCCLVWTRRGIGGLKFYRSLDEAQMQGFQRFIEEAEAGTMVQLANASHAWR
jgi:hypothetical protein